ncbi:hypothetical protein ONS96_001665 [Cadophora gregata f. sp. sojae]|nr:hypothetical protein ONS96_001665 [Cadophora gregata f. sp. sojae]
MESLSSIMYEVSALAATNSTIHTDVSRLQSEQVEVGAQFEANVQALNGLIQRLPELGTMLLRESPDILPTQAESLLEINPITTESIISETGLGDSCGLLQEVIASLRNVNIEIGTAGQAAKSRQLRAADLASRAARHAEKCTTSKNTVLQAQAANQARISGNLRTIANLETQLAEATRMANQMAERARVHDADADGHQIFFWTTFWIPIVNLVTIPVSLTQYDRHQDAAREYRASEARCRQEMQQKQAERSGLQATSDQLDSARRQLESALKSCSEHQRQASDLKDNSRVQTDQYGILSTGIRQVLMALDPLNIDVEVRDWDTLRFTALFSMREMLSALHSEGRLEESNVVFLERLRSIISPGDSVGRFALEWNSF